MLLFVCASVRHDFCPSSVYTTYFVGGCIRVLRSSASHLHAAEVETEIETLLSLLCSSQLSTALLGLGVNRCTNEYFYECQCEQRRWRELSLYRQLTHERTLCMHSAVVCWLISLRSLIKRFCLQRFIHRFRYSRNPFRRIDYFDIFSALELPSSFFPLYRWDYFMKSMMFIFTTKINDIYSYKV